MKTNSGELPISLWRLGNKIFRTHGWDLIIEGKNEYQRRARCPRIRCLNKTSILARIMQ